MQLTLRLSGPVQLIGPSDTDLTPRGMKARGALAVLGSAHGLRVNRSRLQDLLYSDRGSEQGAASIRQVLREIRIALGDHRDALLTGPGWIGLKADAVLIDVQARTGPDGQLVEFGADLDIADREFEDWLRDTRAHHAAHAQPAKPLPRTELPRLIVKLPHASDAQSAVLASMILQESVSRAADLMPLDVFYGDPGFGQDLTGIELAAMASRADNSVQMLFSARDRHWGRMLWTRRFGLPDGNTAQMISTVAGNLTIAILHGMQMGQAEAVGHSHRLPIEDVFSYSAHRLQLADQHLAKLLAVEESAIALSLRSYIRNTLLLERLSKQPQTDAEMADEFASKAREMAPGNATVLAVNSLVSAWKHQTGTAFEMARQSQQIDPENPLARLALSNALIGVGRHTEAEKIVGAVQETALFSLGPATWLLRRALASVQMGDLQKAETHFSAAHGFAPENRPALRFLAGIRYHQGDREGARAALLTLQSLEPDFSLELMGSDGYPVDSLREIGLLGVAQSKLI